MQGWSSLLETLQTSNYVVVVVEVVSSSKSLLLYPSSFSGIYPWFIMCCALTSYLQMFNHLKSLFGNEDTAHIYSKSHQFDHTGLARLISRVDIHHWTSLCRFFQVCGTCWAVGPVFVLNFLSPEKLIKKSWEILKNFHFWMIKFTVRVKKPFGKVGNC